ncbi:MAG: sigma-54-dependent Fis family transcriptional regulator [Candidatus Omnitrophica bacterium]|nr:sigma-54-dependent Fis family transcriptional regulator [Candidatus Omnitrophota bacterium]
MEPRSRILMVDDDPLIRGSLYELLRRRHFDVETAADGTEALERLKQKSFRLVITDLRMPAIDGMSLLAHIRSEYPDVSVVLITGFGTIASAVEAIRQGAFDYLTKPVQPEELEATIQRAIDAPGSSTDEDPFSGVIGQHPSIQAICEVVRSLAISPATVLLEGESGTGKRVIAYAIHRADPKRKTQPFIEVSCGALPETLLESELFGHVRGAFTGAIRDKQGRFELAGGGTILLDEIDTLSPALQVKLLRVLQERVFERVGDTRTLKVDVRVIAATNRPLAELVREGKFREDLYYRVNVIALRLPALRERQSDLPLLIDHFIKRSAHAMSKTITGIDEAALAVLLRYPWPGNIRELENVVERAVVLSRRTRLGVEDLPDPVRASAATTTASAEPGSPAPTAASETGQPTELKAALKIPERELILKVLAEVRWNRSEAAQRLGIHRSTLYHKMRQLDIDTSLSS